MLPHCYMENLHEELQGVFNDVNNNNICEACQLIATKSNKNRKMKIVKIYWIPLDKHE